MLTCRRFAVKLFTHFTQTFTGSKSTIKALLLNVSVQNVHGEDVTTKLSIARQGNDNDHDEDGYHGFHSPDNIDVPPFEHQKVEGIRVL